MADIYNRPITVTLTGAQWTAIIAKLGTSIGLSAEGKRQLKFALHGIVGQVTAAADVASLSRGLYTSEGGERDERLRTTD